jgi:hypothetical protein
MRFFVLFRRLYVCLLDNTNSLNNVVCVFIRPEINFNYVVV